MSDISIPGVTSKYNTQKIVEDLVKVKKVHLDNLEKDLTTLKDQKKIWQEMSGKLSQLRDSARKLYSFENPFNLKKAISSDESALTASAERNALEETVSITVKSTAKPDRFLSKSLPKDFRVPSGTYKYTVGTKEFSFKYTGGKLSDFADTLMKRSNGLLKTQIIPNTTSTQVLSIEATKTGVDNRVAFADDAARIGVEIGLLQQNSTDSRTIQIAGNTVQPWQTQLDRNKIISGAESTKILAGAAGSIPINPPMALEKNYMLEMDVKVIRKNIDPLVAAAAPSGPDIPETGGATLAGITVTGSRSEANLPDWTPPAPPAIKHDPVVFFAEGGGISVPLPGIRDTDDFQKIRIPISDYVKTLSAINFRNSNTHRDIEVKNIRLYDPESRGDYSPVNIVTSASNAVIEMNGIEIIRDTNNIKDVIPGVTLNLLKPTDKPIELKIEPDRKAIKDSLINLVGNYNQLITQINILTRPDDAIISEIDYFTDDERKKAEERLGLFQGDLTLMQLKARLQSIMIESYRTGPDNPFAILSQIGISTDSRKPGAGGYDTSKLRGYLEIQESKLDEILKTSVSSIKELFGFDSDGDLIMDSGAAVKLDVYLKSFVEMGGIFPTRQSGIDKKITSQNKEIESYKDYLKRYEQDLKVKYGKMEGALGNLERSSNNIENFSNSNSKK